MELTESNAMKITMRWYGHNDPVTLANIRQIPSVKGIVSGLYQKKPGEIWTVDELLGLKESVEDAGFTLNVIESIPVHEDIKLGRSSRDRYIETYCECMRNISQVAPCAFF